MPRPQVWIAVLAGLAMAAPRPTSAADMPPVEISAVGPTALAPAVRGPRLNPIAFPMDPAPRCYILDNFGDPRSGGRTHQGVDILATLGQKVFATVGGTLTQQGIDGGDGTSLSGNYWALTAESDGSTYVYMHLSAFADRLQLGSTVRAGQLIGYVGDTGNPGTGNYHLHFEYHPWGGAAVDPMPILLPVKPPGCTVY